MWGYCFYPLQRQCEKPVSSHTFFIYYSSLGVDEVNEKYMNTFSITEQQATLQCVWQLFQARPSKDEVEFVEQQTVSWDVLRNLQMRSLAEKEFIKLTCNGFFCKWIDSAIQMNPFQAFQIISNMSDEKKIEFKNFIISIVEYRGNDLKLSMAVSLFDKTDVPYAIAARNWLDFNTENKSRYRII